MTLKELLLQNVTQLPLNRDDGEFVPFLENTFSQYIKAAKTVEELKGDVKVIEKLSEKIVESVKYNLMGQIQKASESFSEGMDLIKHRLSEITGSMEKATYYRLRAIPGAFSPEKQDLFHIPFEKRELVKRQRYSFPGLPCLYLGSTTYVCWEELGRPHFNDVWTSALKPKKPLRFLGWPYPPKILAKALEASTKGISLVGEYTSTTVFDVTGDAFRAYLLSWPLMAACSVRVKNKEAPFVVEYLVPQLLLQWLVSNGDDYDGIMYFSNNVQEENAPFGINFVLPVKDDAKEKGLCSKLVEAFQMTQPAQWSFQIASLRYEGGLPNLRNGDFFTGGSVKSHYWETEFGKIENVLGSLAFDPVC